LKPPPKRQSRDRLDAVVGVAGWHDEYSVLPCHAVACRLSIRIGDVTVTKEDAGGESGQADRGDKTKAAFSDALKRAAVKFGIGRYLYRLPVVWCDYDAKTKKPAKQRQPLRSSWLGHGSRLIRSC
jgi:hypothetical protein